MSYIVIKTLYGKAVYLTHNNCIESIKKTIIPSETCYSFTGSDSFCASNIKNFSIEITQQCNMRCTYCCYSGKYSDMRMHNELSMSDELISKTIKFIRDNYSKESEEIFVNFYGGEALICFEKIKHIIKELEKIISSKITFNISTNGLRLNNSIVDWIADNPNIIVTVTIDGDEKMHDVYRRTISGDGTYDSIARNILYIKDNYPEFYHKRVLIISTIQQIKDLVELSNSWERMEFKDKLPETVSVVRPNFNDPNYSLPHISDYIVVYKKAFVDYYNNNPTLLRRSLENLIRPIQERAIATFGNNTLIKTCLNDISMCYISTTGKIYPCEKVCASMVLGDIQNGFDNKKISNLNKRYINFLNTFCATCWAVRLCQKCIGNLNYSEDEHRQLCKLNKEKIKLALQYFCLAKDLVK